MNSVTDNLSFTPRPIEAVGIRGAGVGIRLAEAIIQRTTALRAYRAFAVGDDWMDKLSSAYVVAIATRSADTYLMQKLQSCIVEDPPISCSKCRERTIGINAIREKLFPKLAELRRHANRLIHHLDDPKNRGVAELNIEGVFDYCHHLFAENSELLFGVAPQGSLPYMKCKKCREADRTK
jgi:hypothetical protein